MKRKLFATIAFLACALSISAQNAVRPDVQITAENAIQEGVSYVLQSNAKNNTGAPVSYIADAGTYYSIPNAGNSATEAAVYQFFKNSDGTWKIKSVYTGKYWGVPVHSSALAPAEESAAGAWTLNFQSSGTVCPTAPNASNTSLGIDRSSGKVVGFTADSSKPAQQIKIFTLADGPLVAGDVTVTRGYQTCGRGNENSLMLRIDVNPYQAISNVSINVNLNAAAVANLSSLYIHETTATEFIANIPATPKATASVSNTVSFNIGNVSAGTHHFWLCATVKDNAELGAILEASLTGINYTYNSTSKSLDLSSKGTLSRQGMKVYNQQAFVFQPTSDGNRFYRIPAMILDKEGHPVVAIDRRYDNNADLGNNKIDVSIKRSEDNGRTWSNQNIVAVGNTAIEARYGYGDAALARTKNGRIICLMACGQNNYFGTSGRYNKWVGMLTSDDNGVTWQGNSDGDPILITEDAFGGRGQSVFVTSGKGLTTEDGTVMFAVNVKRTGNKTSDCYILATEDEGETWTLLPNNAYSGCDESKLEQMNDGSLLLSVRQPGGVSSGLGNRGWNKGSADGMTWGTQYQTSDIVANPCNADILYYSRTTKGAKRDILLHSYINTSERESLQLAMSIDGGESWHDVYNIQPNGACYSTIQKLNDGSLAILYEDASFCTDMSSPFKTGNGFAINFITITKEQIENWYDELVSSFDETPEVKIVEQGVINENAPLGTWQETTTGNWAKKFTTSAASGMAGVVVSTTYNGFNRQYLNKSGTQRVFVMKPSAINANDVITITAPEGYVITGYTIGGYTNNNNETYTLTAESGENVAIDILNTSSSQPNFLNVTGINSKSTTFTMSNSNSANNSFASISHFIVYLEMRKSIVLLDDDRGAEYPNADRISDNLSAATADVTLFGRTLYKDESWNTLCLPFAVNSFDGTPLEGAEVRTLENASFNNGTLTLNFSEGLDAIEAGKPYIVRWTSGANLKNPEFTGVQLSDATPEIVFDHIGMTFKGVYSPFAFEAQDKSKLYMGNSNTLYYPKKAMTIKAFRAFFDLGSNLMAAEPSTNAGAKEITNFVLNFGDGTTSLTPNPSPNREGSNDWYLLDGRKVVNGTSVNGKLPKGIYVVEGKKVVIK